MRPAHDSRARGAMGRLVDRLASASDATLAREAGPLRGDGRFIRMAPFGLIGLVAVALALMPGSAVDGPYRHPEADVLGIGVFVVMALLAVLVPWQYIPPAWQVSIPLLYCAMDMLLRHAEGSGDAGYTILYILPVAWVALYSPAWQFATVFVLSAALIVLPPYLDGPILGEQHYPVEDYRLTVIVILIIAFVAAALRITTNTAARDPLTGIPNRRTFMATLQQQADDGRVTGRQVCVGVIDLDHFKAFNDTNGHAEGDRLLVDTTVAWDRAMRPDDTLGRIGGEEFAVVINAPLEDARHVAERLLAAIPDSQTASIGLCPIPPGADPDQALRCADDAMYRAKRDGRARVVVARD